ncbi:MAG: hypothetical protein AAFN74_06135 [Myxococcota bacterium]
MHQKTFERLQQGLVQQRRRAFHQFQESIQSRQRIVDQIARHRQQLEASTTRSDQPSEYWIAMEQLHHAARERVHQEMGQLNDLLIRFDRETVEPLKDEFSHFLRRENALKRLAQKRTEANDEHEARSEQNAQSEAAIQRWHRNATASTEDSIKD